MTAALKLVPPESESPEPQEEERALIDPHKVHPLHAWILVREDPDPSKTPSGLLFIPQTSKLQGRRNSKATVIAVGDGLAKPAFEGGPQIRWEMPIPGERIAFPVLAHLPDTQQKFQKMFRMEDEVGFRYYFIHAIDVLFAWDPKDGEPEVE